MKSYLFLGMALLSVHLSLAQSSGQNAEIFVQIEDRGNFTVYLDDEFVGSKTGKFRFYNVDRSRPTLSILQGNRKIYSSSVDVQPNQRTVLGFSVRRGIRTLKTLEIYRNNQYALNDFDDYAGAYNTGVVPPRPPRDNGKSFETLLTMINREAFDDEKMKLVRVYANNQNFSTAQVRQLLQKITHDENKLSLAKALAPAVADIQQYYTLKDAFNFIGTKNEFIEFMSGYQSQGPRSVMRQAAFEQLRANVKLEAFDDNKSKLISVALQNSAISTAQLAELLKTYSFDEKALACAKDVYQLVSDRQNYFTLKDVFRFQKTKNDLMDFLAR